MSKLIYITESQLNEIIGNGSYLNQQDSTNEYRFGGAEISVGGTTGDYVDDNVKLGEPVITDKISKRLQNQRRFGGFASYLRKPLNQNIIPESNQDFSGKQNTFQISKSTIDDIKDRLNNYNGDKNNPGVKRAETLIKTGQMSHDNGYRTLNDYENNRGNEILGDKLKNEIRRKLDTAETISKNSKKNKMERGEKILKPSNNIIKGKAHSPKNDNFIGITYKN